MASKKPQDEVFEHEFDGIQEYDNDLPGWWKKLFWGTIIFGVFYMFYFHVFSAGDSSSVEYMKEMDPNYTEPLDAGGGLFTSYHSPFFRRDENLTPRMQAELEKIADANFEVNIFRAMNKATPEQLEKLKTAFPDLYSRFAAGEMPAGTAAADATAADAPTITEPISDATALSKAKSTFETQCFTCHGKAGEGGIGPNLTDEYWIHGGQIGNIITTIRKGVPAKGMIAWDKTLSPEEIDALASYILLKLQGTNPPNAKAPEGTKASDETGAAAAAQ